MRAAFCKAGSVSNMFPDGVGTPSGFFPRLWSCWGYLWTGSQGETVLMRVPRFRKPPKIISNFWLCWLFGPWPPAGTEAICSQVQDHDPLLENGELPPLVGELTHLGLLFKDEGKLDRELDRRFGVASAVFWALGCGEEGTEPEGEAFNLPVDLCRCEQNEIQAAEMGSLPTGGWEHVQRSQLRWSGHLIRGLPGLLNLEVFTSTAN